MPRTTPRHRSTARRPLPTAALTHTAKVALVATLSAATINIGTAKPAQAASESTGVRNERGTVSGRVITTKPDGHAPWNMRTQAGEQGVGGVRVYGYWEDSDGTVSQTYFTTTAPDGTYTLKFPEYVDAAGLHHTFEATRFEKMKIWVDPSTFPAGMTLQYGEARQDLHNKWQRDNSRWTGGHVESHNFALREADNPTLHGTENPSADNDGGTWRPGKDNTNAVRGTVFWDNVTTWGGAEWVPYRSDLDDGAPGIKVRATIKDTDGSTYTVAGNTDANGDFEFFFPEKYDPDRRSGDLLYVSVDGPSGIYMFSPFENAAFTPTDKISGALLGWNSINELRFALYPSMRARFEVVNFDTETSPAYPGATVGTNGYSLAPNRNGYSIRWTHQDGTVIKTCDGLATDAAGRLPSCPFTVPRALTQDTEFTATLLGRGGVVLEADSFLAQALKVTWTPGTATAGTAFTAPAPTVAGGTGAIVYSATGLPPGVRLDANTGIVSGTPTVPGDYAVTLTATDSIQITAHTTHTITVDPAPMTLIDDLVDGVVGVPYASNTPIANGGVGPYAFSATGLPAGLTIDRASGVVSGTPTTAGSNTTTITATDTQGRSISNVHTVTIAPAPVKLTVHDPLPRAEVGKAYVGPAPTVTGGDGTYTFSATGLPAGLTIHPSTGVISGTPTQHGAFTVQVTAQDGAGVTDSGTQSLQVSPAPLKVTHDAFPAATTDQAFTTTAPTATGGVAPYTFSATGLPDGVSINSTTGVISGTPTRSGNYTVTVTVTDTLNTTASYGGSLVVVTVYPILDLPAQNLPTGEVGTAYVGPTPAPTGGDGTYTFHATGLPAGLTINTTTGVITGTPTTTHDAVVSVTVTDGQGTRATFAAPLSVTYPALTMTATTPDGQVGTAYAMTAPNTTGGSGTYSYTATGLPAGLTINTTTGQITGTPTAHGTSSVTFTVTDSEGTTATATTTLRVTPAPITLSVTLTDAEVSTEYTSATPTITGGTGTFTYTASGLPTGLSINPTTGVISGIPQAHGPATVTITATDNAGGSATTTAQLTVAPAPLTVQASAPAARQGVTFAAPAPIVTGGAGSNTFTASNLPAGLSINPTTGVVSGEPTGFGSFTYTVTVTDSQGTVATTDVTITIEPRPVELAATNAIAGTIGRAIEPQTPTATGGDGTYTYTVTGLPDGLTVNSTTGIISGTALPGTAGDYTATLTVTDGGNRTATATIAVNIVNRAIGDITFNYHGGQVGVPYNDGAPTPTGGNGVYTYTATNLPPGLTMNSTTGYMSGTPTTAGSYTIEVTITSDGTSTIFTDVVYIAHPALTIDVTAPTGFQVGSYTTSGPDAVTAGGGDGNRTLALTGLPSGLNFDANTATISGTPTAAGTFVLQATVTDGTGATKTTTATMVVEPAAPLGLTVTAPTNATVGTAYTATTPTTTGGVAPYTYVATGLPPGLTLDTTTGVIAGTPTAHGTYTYTLTALDASGQSAPQTLTHTINPAALTATATAPSGTDGQAYVGLVATPSGGVGPYTYAVTAGTLPAGIALDATTGALGGTPTAAGDSTFTVTIEDSLGTTTTVDQTVTIAPIPLTVTGAPLPHGEKAQAYTAPAPTLNGGSGTITYSMSGHPQGLSIDATTGALSGTPTEHGTFTLIMTVADTHPGTPDVTLERTLVVAPEPLVVGHVDLPDGTVGVAYSHNGMTVTGGAEPYTYSATDLPEGLTINSTTGAITGTPTVGGLFQPVITVTDTNGASGSFTDELILAMPFDPLEFAPLDLPDAQTAAAYNGPTPTVTGGDGNVTYTATGLPPGLTLDAASGVLSGVPTTTGSYQIIITATDGQGSVSTHTEALQVSHPPLTLAMTPPKGTVGVAYATPGPTVTGGSGTYTFAAVGLPTGLTLDETTGAITGTPTTLGDYPVTITVTDSEGVKESIVHQFHVVAGALVPTLTLPNGVMGEPYTDTAPTVTGGVGPYTFAALGLPTGVAIDADTGTVSGTPTTYGTYTATVTVRDARGVVSSVASEFSVAPAPLSGTHTPPSAVDGQLFTAPPPELTGGVGPFTYTATALPDGIALDPVNGGMTGTPSGAGTYNYTITVTDTAGQSYDIPGTLIVDPGPLVINNNATDGTTGVAYTSPLPTTSGGDGTYTYSAAGLPAGLSVDPNTGVISGMPTTPGDFAVVLTVTDGTGTTATSNHTLHIAPGVLTLPATELPRGTQGTPYTATLQSAKGGVAPYVFSASGLPAGLRINSETGEITGTPTEAGAFAVSVIVADADGGIASFTDILNTGDGPEVTALAITTSELPNATVDQAYASPPVQVVGGGTGTRKFTAVGLPDGLSIDPNTGAITGTPTASGTFHASITVTVQDSYGQSASFTDVVIVAPRPMTLSFTLAPAAANTAYESSALNAEGGAGAPTYTVEGLPAGLTMDPATGVITGTPTAPGSYVVVVTAADGQGHSATSSSTLTVARTPLTVNGTYPDGMTDKQYTSTAPTITGADGAVTYTAVNIPPGLTINPTTGVLSGTPNAEGAYHMTVTATDAQGTTGSLTTTINIVLAPLAITPTSFPALPALGEFYTTQAPTATGGIGTYRFTATGLPTGLSIDASTGIISGTPTTATDFPANITVTVSDGDQDAASFSDTIVLGNDTNDVPPLYLPSVNMPSGQIGTPYTSPAPTPQGGTGPYRFSGTHLPPGMNIDPTTGALTGVPTEPGTFHVHVQVTDANGNTALFSEPVAIAADPLGITFPLPNTKVGDYISLPEPDVTGGIGPFSYTAQGLPPGLFINPFTGAIRGTASYHGAYSVVVTVTDVHGDTATVGHTMQVAPATLQVNTRLATGMVGESYSHDEPTTTGGVSPYSYSATGLPDGLVIDRFNGIIHGVPTQHGNYTVKYTATDSLGVAKTLTLDMSVVNGTLELETTTPAVFTPGVPYSAPAIVQQGGVAGVTYTATDLPPGLTLDPATGALTGTPTTPGTYLVTITATDPDGSTASLTHTITSGTADDAGTFSLNGPAPVRQPVTETINVPAPVPVGTSGPVTYTVEGLPPGLTFDTASGAITGTTDDIGNHRITVTATADTGATASYTLDIVTEAAELTLDVALPDTAVGDTYLSAAPTPTGGVGPFSFMAKDLPPGLVIDAQTGIVTGTPTAIGTFNPTISVTDATGNVSSTTQAVFVHPAKLSLSIDQWLTDAVQNINYTSGQPQHTGGEGPFVFSASGMPPGLSIASETGIITGTATKDGTFMVTLTVTDTHGSSATATGPLTVAPNQLTIDDGGQIPAGLQGNTFTYPGPTITGGSGTYTFTATGLPPGLTLDPDTGGITGTATGSGDYTVVIVATDAHGHTTTITDVLTIFTTDPGAQAPEQPIDLPDVDSGQEYVSPAPDVSDMAGDVTFTATGLPPGLAVNTASGVISGTPTEDGRYKVVVTATDTNGITRAFADIINVGGVAALTIEPLGDYPQLVAGEAFTGPTPSVSGGNNYVQWSADDLPPGLNINPDTGVISGTPSVAGVWNTTVTAQDGAGATSSVSVPITVTVPPLELMLDNNDSTITGVQGQALPATTITATGGTAPYSFSATGLPPGMSLATLAGSSLNSPGVLRAAVNTARITGTPTTAGRFTATVIVQDADGRTAMTVVEFVISSVTGPTPDTPGGTPPADQEAPGTGSTPAPNNDATPGTNNNTTQGKNPGNLSRSGSPIGAIMLLGGALLVAGTGLLIARRRRDTST